MKKQREVNMYPNWLQITPKIPIILIMAIITMIKQNKKNKRKSETERERERKFPMVDM